MLISPYSNNGNDVLGTTSEAKGVVESIPLTVDLFSLAIKHWLPTVSLCWVDEVDGIGTSDASFTPFALSLALISIANRSKYISNSSGLLLDSFTLADTFGFDFRLSANCFSNISNSAKSISRPFTLNGFE